jgi:hypothetical protein
MVTNEEVNEFYCGVPQNIKIELREYAKALEMTDDKMVLAYYKAFNLPSVVGLMPLDKRYEEAFNQLRSQIEIDCYNGYKSNELDDLIDVAGIEEKAANGDSQLRKLDLSGLPNFNYVGIWGSYLSSPTYYQEALFQNSVQSICSLSLKTPYAFTKDIYGNFFEEPLYTNLYSICFMPPGISKTLTFRAAHQNIVLARNGSKEIFTPVAPSPEALKKELATALRKRYLKKKSKKERDANPDDPTEEMVEEVIPYEKEGMIFGHRCMWDEEMGGYFEGFKKPYMAGSAPTICSLYSNMFPGKGNVGKDQGETYEYQSDDPYLSINAFTVPISMWNHLSYDFVVNGFIPRFLIFYAKYLLPLPPLSGKITDLDEEIDMLIEVEQDATKKESMKTFKKAVENASHIIMELCKPDKYGGKFQVEIHPEAYREIIDWEIRMKQMTRNNPHVTDMRGRNFENAYKLAILLTLGNLPYLFIHRGKPIDDSIVVNQSFEDVKDMDAFMDTMAHTDAVRECVHYKIKRLVS